ncbi:MAG TPA: hypothetical protein VGF26_06060 [Ramlibacter sp.]
MNENKTSSMLQRLPVILAVTAASYGLQLPVSAAARPAGAPKAQNSKTHAVAPVRTSVNA